MCACILSRQVSPHRVPLHQAFGHSSRHSGVWLHWLQLDREKQAEALLSELASVISRYRGPLLESSVDLEQRLWHLATMTGEVGALVGLTVVTLNSSCQEFAATQI